MWQQIHHTLSATLELCNRYYKTLAKAGLLHGRRFFILGFFLSFPILLSIAFILQSSWAELGDGDALIFMWGGYAVRTALAIMVMSAGMLAAYLRPYLQSGQAPSGSFETFAGTIPRKAWRLFFLFSLLICIVYYIVIHGQYTKYTQQEGILGLFRNFNRSGYLSWLYDIADIVSSLLPFWLAGLLYMASTGLRHARARYPSFISLIITGYAFNLLFSNLYIQLSGLLLQPVLLLAGNQWAAFIAGNLLEAVIYMNCVLVIAYLVYSAFTEQEEKLDIETTVPV